MHQKMKILVVDDNRSLADNLQDILDEKGYAASVAQDGHSAMDLCRSESFDLVLLDYQLPDMDGLQLQNELSRLTCADYIIITGNASIDSAARAVQRKKIVGYEIKPLDMDRLLAFIHQIFKRWRAETALQKNEETFRLAFENANIGMCMVSLEGVMTRVNPEMCKIFGYRREELEGMSVNDFAHPEDVNISSDYIRESISGRLEHIVFEKRYFHKKGHLIVGQVSSSLVKDAHGKELHFISHVIDITKQKQAEETIKNALAEKEILLRELNHRTKNNLQIISGMIALQKGFIQDENIRVNLQKLEHKIQAMGLVHEKLYQSKDLKHIDLKEYIKDLVTLLIQSYQSPAHIVTPQLDLKSVPISIETAVPCGQVLNELISNGFKYAFSVQKNGRLQIRLSQSQENEIALIYSDNGPGVPDHFDFRAQDTMGMQTIFFIVEHQLKGTVEFKKENGLSCRICFKDIHERPC